MLILEGFLWEEIVVNKDYGACAYVKEKCLEQLKEVVLATAQGLQDTMISGVNEVTTITCL